MGPSLPKTWVMEGFHRLLLFICASLIRTLVDCVRCLLVSVRVFPPTFLLLPVGTLP